MRLFGNEYFSFFWSDMSNMPGPSSAPPFTLTKAAENYSRLCQLIVTVCSDLFRFILSHYIEPANLRQELDKNRSSVEKAIKCAKQRQMLYPSTGSSSVSAQDLDLSSLYTLLRNICNIPQPQCKWGQTPLVVDSSLVACIERIKNKRNSILGHHSNGEINDTEFQDIWKDLKDNILEIEAKLFGEDMFERRVDDLFSCDLSQSDAIASVKEFQRLHGKNIFLMKDIVCWYFLWPYYKYIVIKDKLRMNNSIFTL